MSFHTLTFYVIKKCRLSYPKDNKKVKYAIQMLEWELGRELSLLGVFHLKNKWVIEDKNKVKQANQIVKKYRNQYKALMSNV